MSCRVQYLRPLCHSKIDPGLHKGNQEVLTCLYHKKTVFSIKKGAEAPQKYPDGQIAVQNAPIVYTSFSGGNRFTAISAPLSAALYIAEVSCHIRSS